MSLEEVLTNMSNKLNAKSEKFENLQADVDSLKAAREKTNEASRSRCRSPRRLECSRSRSRSHRRPDRSQSRSSSPTRTPFSRRSSAVGTSSMSSHRVWADHHPDKTLVYDADIRYADEGDDVGLFTQVSEETERLLKTLCTRSVSNEVRRRTQSRYKLPKVEAMRTPCLDHFMHTLAPQTAKVADRELFRIQTFVLDPLSPLTTIDTGQERHVNRGDKGGINYSCGGNWKC